MVTAPAFAATGTGAPVDTFVEFQKDLSALMQEMDVYNEGAASREFPYNSPLYCFNPKYLETSVSV